MHYVTRVKKQIVLFAVIFSTSLASQATLIIDDFDFLPYDLVNHPFFSPVTANQVDPSQFASSTTGNILGGERDISVDMTQLLGTYAQGSISNGWFGGLNMPLLSVGLNWTGEFAFTMQYDGVDGAASQNASPGLNLNAAQSGSVLQIGYHRQLIYDGNLDGDADPTGNSTWHVALTDNNGQVSVLSQTIVGYQLGGGVNYLNYDFAGFEANNALFDISNIRAIDVSSTIVGMGPGSSWIELAGIAIAGDEYTQLNTPGTGTIGKPSADVSTPASLAFFGIALGLFAWRRKP
jgi:hypothetical protein